MRRIALALVLSLVLGGIAVCQEPQVSRRLELLPKEQKKAIEKAEKLRKKFKGWFTVLESRVDNEPVYVVGSVGWCGGNLNWIFCTNSPILAGGAVAYVRGRWEETGEEFWMRCSPGEAYFCTSLAPGRYPAKKLSRFWYWGLYTHSLLANVGGELKSVTFSRL